MVVRGGGIAMSEPKNAVYQMMLVTGSTTLLLASALAYVFLASKKFRGEEDTTSSEPEVIAVDKEQYPGGQVSVYYATQTGTAESFAHQLEREGAEHGFLVHVVDLEEINPDQMVDESRRDMTSGRARAIILTATYGEGEAPDNSVLFVNALKEMAGCEILFEQEKDHKDDGNETSLSSLDYCVFGLGNRQYDHYNALGKFFDHALERTGANRLLPLGLGDDDDDIDSDFETWKDKKLWPTLKKLYLPATEVKKKKRNNRSNSGAGNMPECQYAVEYHGKNSVQQPGNIPLDQVHSSSRHYFTVADCPVTTVRELRTKEDPGSTVHVEIDISAAKDLTYESADNLGVIPMNDPAVVESVAESLGYDLDAIFSVKASPGHGWHGAPFPMPISIRDCLTCYKDLTSAPRRSDLKLLAAYAKDVTDQKALKRLSSKENRAEYRTKIVDGYVGLVDLLKLCPSIELPLEHFLALCPNLQTRFFTISSSSSVFPDTVHLTVSVTTDTRKDGSVFKGVCSNYLASRKPGRDKIRVFNRPSTFRLPKDSSVPILMIGPGTGVAPMRALLQERSYERKTLNKQVGKNVLYFGCKMSSQDYLYHDELKIFQQEGVLDQLHVAFSREQAEKVYVQNLLRKNAADTWKLIHDEEACIYICGGVKMGRDVSETLKDIIVEEGKLSVDAAKDFLHNLTQNGRFVQELW